MRVFCPEHHRGFFAPRQNPIKCGNQGHTLGELDFAGEAKPPGEIRWQYCCNCEHFCPTGYRKDSIERCPVCGRQSSGLYLCDRCYTISFESNTPVQTKNFTLTSEGAPQPSCPGCLQAASADLREHTCDGLGASFITALSSCPICQERLDIGPSFPSSVAHYLKRTKAGNKLNVTFDYESELFVPVEDGEFVLIRNGNETVPSIVLPRSSRFATKQHFYDFYQDYYHCAKPGAGEVQIIQPAAVDGVAGGWKLQAPGILEVQEDKPKKKAPAGVTRHRAVASREKAGLSLAATKQESPLTPCIHCGSLVETKYAFCWNCGNPLTLKNEPSVTPSEKPITMMPSAAVSASSTANVGERSYGEAETASAAVVTEEDETTVQHPVVPASSPIFSWALPKEAEWPSLANATALKLIGVALVGLVLMSLGLFLLMRSASTMSPRNPTQAVAQEALASPSVAPGRAVERNVAMEPTQSRTSAARPEDNELKKLRERRIAARASDRSAILEAFVTAEKQYPNDYRFPYERAKFAIKVLETHSHDEAFAALSLAAERAIASGKAHEMLDSLQADKAADFHKLSHGHVEWTQLQKALQSNDKSLVGE
jgi:hypothetical protein